MAEMEESELAGDGRKAPPLLARSFLRQGQCRQQCAGSGSKAIADLEVSSD
jgi:hypothetical protein